MTPTSGLMLFADFAGAGLFGEIGAMPEPSREFAKTIQDLRKVQENPGLRQVFIYPLAAGVAGTCLFYKKRTENVIRACLEARIVFEWSLVLPELGTLQALFRVQKFQPANAPGLHLVSLQLAGKPSFHFYGPDGDGNT